jgi:hypothetical protein
MITIVYKCTLLIDPVWRTDCKVTWAEYVAMSQYRAGEGTTWKALI